VSSLVEKLFIRTNLTSLPCCWRITLTCSAIRSRNVLPSFTCNGGSDDMEDVWGHENSATPYAIPDLCSWLRHKVSGQSCSYCGCSAC
jgi:hypothetical protein